jgi:hypothetical protein
MDKKIDDSKMLSMYRTAIARLIHELHVSIERKKEAIDNISGLEDTLSTIDEMRELAYNAGALDICKRMRKRIHDLVW